MIKLAVSACLLGQNVRYDGKNKKMNLTSIFPADKYSLTAICPEVGMGLPVPRKPIQINKINDKIELVQVEDPSIHYHKKMQKWFNVNLDYFKQFSGFILKSKSPSCGNQSTPHFQSDSTSIIDDGYFVYLLKIMNPDISIIDEVDIFNEDCLINFKIKINKF